MSEPTVHPSAPEDVEDELLDEEEEGKPATGLIGNGEMVDPRYIAPR